MPVNFDGDSKLIIATSGTTTLDIAYVYSRWKDWVMLSDNSKYLNAFSVIGGDPIGGGIFITPYFFLENGWKIRPQEANHVLTVTGNVVVQGGLSEPFISTLGNYNVSIRSFVPIKTETVGSAGDPWDTLIETGYTAKQIMRILAAIATGKTDINNLGGGNATVAFRDINDTKDRVTANMTGSERTSVTLDAS